MHVLSIQVEIQLHVVIRDAHDVALLRKAVRWEAILLFVVVVHRPIVPQDEAVSVSA